MDLAEEYGLGRGRVRETFRILTGQGYLQCVANRGVLVRRSLRAAMLEMGRAREVLEGLAARLAAETAPTEPDRTALEALQAEMNRAEADRDVARFSEDNQGYHRLIERIAANAYVTEFIDRVRLPLVKLHLPRRFETRSMAKSNRDHRVVTAAILAGTPEAAEAAMRAHVRAGNDHIAALPDAVFAD